MTSESTSPRQLLVVDDEPTLRMSIQILLEAEGYDVQTARDGEEALLILGQDVSKFDAVLLDLRMPGLNGIGVLREAANLFDQPLPAILCSAYLDSPTAIEAVQLGVVDFLRKPVTPNDLRHAINNLLDEEDQLKRLDDGEEMPASTCARLHLRRRHLDEAIAAFENAPDDNEAERNIWLMIAYHLRACREGRQDQSKLASSNFYHALDVLSFLSIN